MIQLVQIRDVREADDFEKIYVIINDTYQRFSVDNVTYGQTGAGLKQIFGDPDSPNKGFIAEKDGSIVAFMGVYPKGETNNGLIECGYLDEYESILEPLLDKCMAVVQEKNGVKVYKFTSTLFGQVRNKQISLWEKLGFTSDEYSLITTMLYLSKWNVPDMLDTKGIEPALEMNYDEIKQMLIEDGNDEMAELFQRQYSPNQGQDQVILTLKDTNSNEISGIAYYRVSVLDKGMDQESLGATAFGIHVRPKYIVTRDEISRFVQGSLASMKQLNIDQVITRITLKNFAIFSAMVAEGFHNEGLENANVLRLSKSIQKD